MRKCLMIDGGGGCGDPVVMTESFLIDAFQFA